MIVSKHRVFADHHQFYLSDSGHPGVPTNVDWTKSDFERMLVVEDRFSAVFTARSTYIPVSVEVHPEEISFFSASASHVVEFSLSVPSGKLRLCGCTDAPETAPIIDVPKGNYAGLVVFERLDSTFLFGLIGFDRYRIILWPGHPVAPRIVKAWHRAGAG